MKIIPNSGNLISYETVAKASHVVPRIIVNFLYLVLCNCESLPSGTSTAIEGKLSSSFVLTKYKMSQRLPLPSISSTFYACIFCTKFWRQKLQSCVLGLKFFGTKILCKNCASKKLMKLTAEDP